MAKYADKHHQDIHLHVGDLVYISTAHFSCACQLSHKLTQLGLDPFPITHIIYCIAFHIYLPAVYGCVHPVFHVSYLRPCWAHSHLYLHHLYLWMIVAAGEYEVEDILNSRIGHSRPEYIVKWLGYPVFESMW